MTGSEAVKASGRSGSWLKRHTCAFCDQTLWRALRSGCGAIYEKCNPTQKDFTPAGRTSDSKWRPSMNHEIEDDEDVPCCMACAAPLKDGDDVYNELEGDIIHAACCGPERESYFGADEQPLTADEPVPAPWKWAPVMPRS